MCEPTTIALASLALASVSAGATVYASNKSAQAQNKANEVQAKNSMTAYRANLANIEVERNQNSMDVSSKVNSNNAAARAANASARVAAGEAGVSGLSVDALLRDLSGEAGFDNTNIEENYLRNDQALNSRRENAYNGTASSINTLRTPVSPDYLGAGLRIGEAAVNSYGTYKKLDAIQRGEQ